METIAIRWWNELDFDAQFDFFWKYNPQFQYKSMSHLMLSDISMIYEKEFVAVKVVYERVTVRDQIFDMFEDYV